MRHRTGMCVLMMILGLSLSACGGAEGGNRAEQLALDIRGEYLEMGGCTASLELTADYGQRVYTYGIGLNYAREGETTLTITAPENIAGSPPVFWGGRPLWSTTACGWRLGRWMTAA